MREHARQLARNGLVNALNDREICGKEDVKVALVNLLLLVLEYLECMSITYKRCPYRHHPPLKSCLHDRRIDSLDSIGKVVEITRNQAVTREVLCEDIKEF